MVELAPQTKNQEERPLLKVEGGSGDGRPMPPADTAWSVHCSKRYWFDRWPEFLTACWMTGILLAISFLVMYVLTVGTVRRQPVVILKCNTSKPNSEVYYHQIIQRQSTLLFSLYEDYLAKMATAYPALHFNVIFMIDDTTSQINRRAFPHVNVYGRLIPFHSKKEAIINFQIHNSLKIREFQHKYQNVNVTVIALSEYMARTQLRYKWRTIPLSNLSFYARISSVWQTGGIGIDLPLYSTKYSHQLIYPDKKVEMILKQHNDGINIEEYRRILDTIEINEESEFISVICGIINQMIKDTTDFFNSSYWFPFVSQNKLNTSNSLVRDREKREVTEKGNIIDTSTNVNNDAIKSETVKAADPKKDHKMEYNKPSNKTNINAKTESNFMKLLLGVETKENSTKKPVEGANTTNSNVRIDEFDYMIPNMFLSYQVSLLSDDLGVMYLGYPKSENFKQAGVEKLGFRENLNNLIYNKPHKSVPYFLTLSSKGSFVASTSVMHPLLGHLLSLGCRRMSPKIAIQEAFLNQCSESTKNDIYCDNIYLLNLA